MARTGTLNGPDRWDYCINIKKKIYLGITNRIIRTAYPNNWFLLTKQAYMRALKLVCGGDMPPFVDFPLKGIDKTHTKHASIPMGNE